MNWQQQLWRTLRGNDRPARRFPALEARFAQAHLLVRVYDLYLLYVIYAIGMISWPLSTSAPFEQPLWPLAWAQGLEPSAVMAGLILGALASGLWVLFCPTRRLARLSAAIGFFLLITTTNSLGKINHSYHALVFVQWVLIFWPNRPVRGSGERQLALNIFWLAQLLVGLFYTLSGGWKLWFGLQQWWAGEMSSFHPFALATWVAFRNLQTNQQALLAEPLLNWPWLGWPLHLGAIYLESCALLAAFRPRLHRLWGGGLALFHLGTWLLMGVPFPTNMLLIWLLFGLSPFAPERTDWPSTLASLPLFGPIWQLVLRR